MSVSAFSGSLSNERKHSILPIPDPHRKKAIIMDPNPYTTRWKLAIAQITPKNLKKCNLAAIKLVPKLTARAQHSTQII